MKTKTILLLVAIAIIGLIAVVSILSFNTNANPYSSYTAPQDGVQTVKLSYSNYRYVLEPATLQAGVPVRMEVDMNSVVGCMRSIVIPAFGVRKTVSPADNIIEFIPTKTGQIDMSCSMGMGRGSFYVVDTNGDESITATTASQPSAYAQTTAVQDAGQNLPSTCGGSGGCGCGQ